MHRYLTATGLLVVLSAVPIHAQTSDSGAIPKDVKLVHLDTPITTAAGQWAGYFDVRSFAGNEDLVYATVGLHAGVGRNWELILRGAFADRKDFALGGGNSIRHGGNDLELAAKYGGQHGIGGLIGVSFPGTPAQNTGAMTLGAMAATGAGRSATVYINPRAVFLDNNTICGIGIGARAKLSSSLSVIGDWTPIVSGDNTRDTTSGARRRSDLYGIAVRYTSTNGQFAFDLGYANGTGSTTGFGLTPGLGGDGAFYFSITARR